MKNSSMSGEEILNLPMEENDSGETTIRGYLKALLGCLWSEEEGFSGKRPFGNSGWASDLYRPLVDAGVIKGKIDDGYLESCDREAGNDAIFKAIEAM